ncbi:MAG: hypothetical protein P4L03_05315 [Terracidiphilus sp.]|nr:hypothetical protein [Terracidiphilus sp.]
MTVYLLRAKLEKRTREPVQAQSTSGRAGNLYTRNYRMGNDFRKETGKPLQMRGLACERFARTQRIVFPAPGYLNGA